MTIPNEIALAVTREISVVLTTSEHDRLASSQTVDPDAYVAYLRGNYLSTRSMDGGCVEAERFLLQAIERDPTFAPPHAALAFCYVFPDRMNLPFAEVLPKARAAAMRAVASNDLHANGHVMMGLVKSRLDYDWVGAEREFRRALELAPGFAAGRIAYAEFLTAAGRNEEAIAEGRQALTLSPFWMDHNVAFGHMLVRIGRYDAAIAQLQKTLKLDDSFATARFWLAEAFAYKGEQKAAVHEYLEWLDDVLVPLRVHDARAALMSAYDHGGWRAFWQREVDLAEEEAARPGTVCARRSTGIAAQHTWPGATLVLRTGTVHSPPCSRRTTRAITKWCSSPGNRTSTA